jgi:bacterioferritin-associated ferredoxin
MINERQRFNLRPQTHFWAAASFEEIAANRDRMNPDDELCLCFHVTKRKVVNFLRVERPSRPGQLSECFGAGTGCGWCRTFLERLFHEAAARGETRPDANMAMPDKSEMVVDVTAAEYARLRSAYVRSGGGTPPPGATPVDND